MEEVWVGEIAPECCRGLMESVPGRLGGVVGCGGGQRRSVGGQWGTYVPGRQGTGAPKWGVQNFYNKGKNRSQARFHRWQTSSDSSRLVRTVGEGGAKRQWRSEGASVGTRPGAYHLEAYQEVLFILFFRRIHTDYKNYFVDYCIVMYAVRKGFKSRLTSDHKSCTKGAHKTVILYTPVST